MTLRLCGICGRVGLATLLALSADGAESLVGGKLLPGAFFEAFPRQPGTLASDANPSDAPIRIVVLEGEDAVNLIRKQTAVQPVVEVRDRNNKPIAGIAVTFSTPTHGPTAVFPGGSHSLTIVTDAQGRARAIGLQPMNKGKFEISVSTTYEGAQAIAKIVQNNVAGGSSAPVKTSTRGGIAVHAPVIIGVTAGVVAAAVVAGVVVSRGGTKTVTINPSPGTPTVGAP